MLDLQALEGPIPDDLGRLSHLQTLSMYNNAMNGTIPVALGSLSSLTDLVLTANQLTGSIPPSLGSALSLRVLMLSANQLQGSIPPSLGWLPSLEAMCVPQAACALPACKGLKAAPAAELWTRTRSAGRCRMRCPAR